MRERHNGKKILENKFFIDLGVSNTYSNKYMSPTSDNF